MTGTKEISALSDSFEHMAVRIQKLMEEVRQEEISLRKTELKALQAQINPHFLYNTLDAIAWMCEAGRNEDAVEMVNALARLFRISISRGHELIPIEKELQHAQSYLHIQNFRYKNQFRYQFDVDEACLSYYCNKITLQPIIENAIYHGMDRMVDEGMIRIGIHQSEDKIIFTVEDNGVGMTEEQCEEVLKKERSDRARIGIKNVNDRIKIYFGEEYGLTIKSELDEGTCVTIMMPKVTEEAMKTNRWRNRILWMAFLVCLVMIFCLTAFHRPILSGKESESSSDQKHKVVFIAKSTVSGFWKSVYAGASNAATACNLDLIFEDQKTKKIMRHRIR